MRIVWCVYRFVMKISINFILKRHVWRTKFNEYFMYATYTMFYIIISALHVSGSFSARHQELIKVHVQPWVLSCFSEVPTHPHQR